MTILYIIIPCKALHWSAEQLHCHPFLWMNNWYAMHSAQCIAIAIAMPETIVFRAIALQPYCWVIEMQHTVQSNCNESHNAEQLEL